MSAQRTSIEPIRRPVLGSVDLIIAVLILFGIWVGLPSRWWPVDVIGTVEALLLAAAGIGLLTGQSWGRKVGLAAGWTVLVTGLAVVTTLAFTASYLVGLYGPVGQGGALLLLFVALLVLPYLVFGPASQLYFLARKAPEASAEQTQEPSEKSVDEDETDADGEEEGDDGEEEEDDGEEEEEDDGEEEEEDDDEEEET